ncbi:RNA polymerase sigma-70 region 4 [uncultured Caudovirales phage]|uniref:RNA polymerase sigma-70 region 4 n=1 Tax=uncultured Caudovirales phage TaxID=2100421 RepID=A0A6J5L4T9_9CAUD|nr:RNA polymerase sigma-70 region 4 [uncultured Caudovirales phage]CAB5216920.1 RNA polymerase sigma-70 region 4 [uncultured Caudovirales phage]
MLDVRKMLYSYKKLEVGLANIERSLQNLASIREYPAGVASYSDMPKASGISNTTERYAFKNINEQEETEQKRIKLEKDLEAYSESLNLIRSALQTLTPEESEVIRLRYFQGYRMTKVAICLDRSQRHITFVHSIAIQSIEQCLNGGRLDLKLNWFDKKEKPQAQVC